MVDSLSKSELTVNLPIKHGDLSLSLEVTNTIFSIMPFKGKHHKIASRLKEKFNIDYIYTQKGGEKNHWVSYKVKTLVHYVYPQYLKEIHGHKYIGVSEWHSKNFSNNKIPFLPYIVQINKSKQNLKKKLKIKKKQIVFGCHGGESSFDLRFVQDTLLKIVKKRGSRVGQ